MKKFLLMLMTAFFIFAASGCHTGSPPKFDKQMKTEMVVQKSDQLPIVKAMAYEKVDAPVILAQATDSTATDSGGGGWLSNLGSGIINVILFVITSLFGGLWLKFRTKVKQIADLFNKAYQYTDDNQLSETERQDLMNQFLIIIGKKPVQRE